LKERLTTLAKKRRRKISAEAMIALELKRLCSSDGGFVARNETADGGVGPGQLAVGYLARYNESNKIPSEAVPGVRRETGLC
jgi:hypothetical protein